MSSGSAPVSHSWKALIAAGALGAAAGVGFHWWLSVMDQAAAAWRDAYQQLSPATLILGACFGALMSAARIYEWRLRRLKLSALPRFVGWSATFFGLSAVIYLMTAQLYKRIVGLDTLDPGVARQSIDSDWLFTFSGWVQELTLTVVVVMGIAIVVGSILLFVLALPVHISRQRSSRE